MKVPKYFSLFFAMFILSGCASSLNSIHNNIRRDIAPSHNRGYDNFTYEEECGPFIRHFKQEVILFGVGVYYVYKVNKERIKEKIEIEKEFINEQKNNPPFYKPRKFKGRVKLEEFNTSFEAELRFSGPNIVKLEFNPFDNQEALLLFEIPFF